MCQRVLNYAARIFPFEKRLNNIKSFSYFTAKKTDFQLKLKQLLTLKLILNTLNKKNISIS